MKVQIYYFLFINFFSIGICYLQLAMKLEEKENTFCFEVLNATNSTFVPDKSAIAVVLQVNYPKSIAEAGQAVIKNITLGQHNLTYKYVVTKMIHDLQVFVDGEEIEFLKSAVSMWHSASVFREVSILTEGNIRIHCKEETSLKPNLHHSITNSENSKGTSFQSSSLTNHSSGIEDVTQPQNNSKSSNQSTGNHLFVNSTNQTPKLTLTDEHKLQNNNDSYNEHNKTEQSEPNENGNFSKLYTEFPSYWGYNAGRTESSLQCLNEGDCDSPIYDYTIAYVLFGLLGGLVFFAIVVSLVFHKKKKKYLPAAPTNRMHQLYENSYLVGESNVERLTHDIHEQKSEDK